MRRLLGRLVYGHRYDQVPWARRAYVRPGERLIREVQWQRLISRAPVLPLEEYRRLGPPAGEFLACPMCGEDRQQPLYGQDCTVVRCPSCGFLYRNPLTGQERAGGTPPGLRRCELTLRAFSPVLDEGKERRLLDVGPGGGPFLDLAGRLGFHARGARPEDVPGLAGDEEDGFDVITLWSVLERLPRPLDDLRALRRLLAPGGVLLVLTLNARSLLLKAHGPAWPGFAEEHLRFYSSHTIRTLLGRTGFAGVAFAPSYGDAVEDGSGRLPPHLVARLRRTVERGDGGDLLRALAFADEEAIGHWGAPRLAVHRLYG
ncbi:class I SAM-dependent methyltransferase [Actinomadura sp. ATCC 31491]|uniref:Class I SAM-dependent methyltransferase n=1 Tax=Actinomadura luzonensis TaxID=2805427 RepID=A0ABT0FYR3_9ACTN|nr:class I SAM-dependent methyltransferase [Actinomadura luzonensis]MCK2217462.1 class I SAM-dependent methyltransferase [Actinomadura luzonensis]